MESQEKNFFNYASIIMTVVQIGVFLTMLSLNIKHLKRLSFKIKTILKAAHESKSPFLAFKSDIGRIKHTKKRAEIEKGMQEIKDQEEAVNFRKIYMGLLDTYHHIMVWICVRKKFNLFNFLKPQAKFYHFLNLTGCFIVWFISVFFAALLNNYYAGIDSYPFTSILAVGVTCAAVSSVIIVGVTKLFHKYY